MIKLLCEKSGWSGGPKMFRDRIRLALKKVPGILITGDEKSNFDLELVFIRNKTKHNKPFVIRLDGVYYKKKHLYHNDPIVKSAKKAKHIIFQSEFSAKMFRRITGFSPKASTIVCNGIDLKKIAKIVPDANIPPGSIVACSQWKRRPNKRPLSIIKGYLEAGISNPLFIIGKTNSEWREEYQNKNVFFLGELKASKIISIMKACDYQIHLCHIDSCPNVVVEGLACGLNVLCSNLGGTKEIVRGDGVVLDVDDWNFKPLSTDVFNSLDNLDPKIVAQGIHDIIKIKTRANRPDLDINLVAQKYVDVFRRCV